jgi:DNA-binding transcriptional MocR family regulator
MATWQPDLSRHSGPRYLAIADAIAESVERGELRPGDRMPTHRDLADLLGVTVGTVTRAYAEAIRRGLIVGETGRGTFVRRELFEDALAALSKQENAGLIDLNFNSSPMPPGDALGAAFAVTLAELAASPDFSSLLGYNPTAALARHRAAGAEWVARSGLKARPERVLVCHGALHAMTAVFMTIAGPGDTVLTEELTYPAMKNLASLLHLNLRGLPMDGQGLRPDAFERACAEGGAKALYCLPTIHNPTATVMPEARRREIAAVARAHDVAIVEDDIYGFLLPDQPLPIVAFAPEQGYYIASLSKCLGGGLRIGYLFAPERTVDRLATTVRTTVWTASPLMAEVAARWLQDGTAERLIEQARGETAARQELARELLAGLDFSTHPQAFHLWLQMPEPWCANDFVALAAQRGVAVTPPAAFVPGRGPSPHAVRVCLGGPPSRAQLSEGLKVLRDLLNHPPSPHLSVI